VVLTEAEYRYLSCHTLARLASIGPDGAPQIHPVVFRVDPGGDSIEIGGPLLHETQKFRNIKRDPRVSLVVDDEVPDPAGRGGQHARGLEIRGAAEVSESTLPLMSGFGTEVIRIRPALIVAWNVGRPGYHTRFVA
jgi:pyridoxamine 5'-phosphate oxidase family protein